MGNIPELISCLCLDCGKEWDGFFPSGRDMEQGIECPSCRKIRGVVSSYEQLYYQLLMCVGNIYPGESRHQTALRYLRRCEKTNETPRVEKKPAPGGEETRP